MKILVLGATGMAGHLIVLYFKEQGYEVTAFSRRPVPFCHGIIGDVRDLSFLRSVLISGEYDIVINCIGILNKNAEENPADAVLCNSYLPHFIAQVTARMQTRLIQMSTDCVFAGNTGPYDETSFPDGRSWYDRTKALGEVDDAKNLTFRNSIIGPDMNPGGIGLFNWFMRQRDAVNGFTKAIWTGVTTYTLAQAMEQGIREELTGIYNLVNNDTISKYDLLQLFNRYFRDDQLIIHPADTLVLDKTLKNTRTDFSFVVPSYAQMVEQMREWIHTHEDLYKHYEFIGV